MIRRILGVALLCGSLAFLAVAMAKTYRRLPHGALHVRPALAVLAVVVVAFSNTASALVWKYVLGARGVDVPTSEAVRICSLSQLGKYLPGGFWQPLGWVGLAREAGVPAGVGAVSVATTMLLTVAAALVVGPLLLVASGSAGAFVWLLAVVPAALVILHPRVLGRALAIAARVSRRPGLDIGGVPFGTVAAGLAAATPIWLLHGTGLAVTAAALQFPAPWVLLTGAFSVAWSVGFLALPVPGGLGIREAVLLLLLRVRFPTAEAVAIAVAFRLVFLIAEAAMTAVALALPKRAVRAPAEI